MMSHDLNSQNNQLWGGEVVILSIKSGWIFNSTGKDQELSKGEDKWDQTIRFKNGHNHLRGIRRDLVF